MREQVPVFSSLFQAFSFRSLWGDPRKSWILGFTLWIPDSRYWIPDSLSEELGLLIAILSGIPDSFSWITVPKPRIQDSTNRNSPGFKISHSEIRITDLTWGDRGVGTAQTAFSRSLTSRRSPLVSIQSYFDTSRFDKSLVIWGVNSSKYLA